MLLYCLTTASGERLRSRLEVGRSTAPPSHSSFPSPLRAPTPPFTMHPLCTISSSHEPPCLHPLSTPPPLSPHRWLGLADCGESVGWKRQKLGPVRAQLSIAGGAVTLRFRVRFGGAS